MDDAPQKSHQQDTGDVGGHAGENIARQATDISTAGDQEDQVDGHPRQEVDQDGDQATKRGPAQGRGHHPLDEGRQSGAARFFDQAPGQDQPHHVQTAEQNPARDQESTQHEPREWIQQGLDDQPQGCQQSDDYQIPEGEVARGARFEGRFSIR